MNAQVSRVGSAPPVDSKVSTWAQTDRKVHEIWGHLSRTSPRASSLAHFLVAHMGSDGAVVASYSTLSKITGMSVATVRRAAEDLRAGRWIEIVQVGGKGGANAFVVNSRVGWARPRSDLHLATFTARVIADRSEQTHLPDEAPLRRIPVLRHGERQLPSGPGAEPPAQPALDGMEPDLPALRADEEP